MVLILGETGAGKSYFIRKLTSNPDVKVGHSLESCKFDGLNGDRHRLTFHQVHNIHNLSRSILEEPIYY